EPAAGAIGAQLPRYRLPVVTDWQVEFGLETTIIHCLLRLIARTITLRGCLLCSSSKASVHVHTAPVHTTTVPRSSPLSQRPDCRPTPPCPAPVDCPAGQRPSVGGRRA